jgi:hypothetical protein
MENILSIQLLLVINLRKGIEDKEDKKGDLRVSFLCLGAI